MLHKTMLNINSIPYCIYVYRNAFVDRKKNHSTLQMDIKFDYYTSEYISKLQDNFYFLVITFKSKSFQKLFTKF